MIDRDINFTKKFFESRDWQTRIMRADEADLVGIREGGIVRCGDGRSMVHRYSRAPYKGPLGPAIFGGWEGYMLNAFGGERKSAAKAITRLLEKGFVPAEHDHCGAKQLARKGELPAPVSLKFEVLHDKDLVNKIFKYGVVGEHVEERLALNFVPGFTPNLDPQGRRFVADAHFLRENNVGLPRVVDFIEGTVRRLSSCRQVDIIVE